MAKINLLDWRGELRTRKRNEFFKLLGLTLLMAIMLVFFAFLIGSNRIGHQEDRIAYLQEEIREVDKRLEEIKDLEKRRQSLLDRMQVIDSLQASRPNIVHLFDEVAKIAKEGTYLTSLVQENDKVLKISGKAESNARVSNLMRDIDASDWTGNPSLAEIRREDKNGNNIYAFSVQADITTPQDQDEEGGE